MNKRRVTPKQSTKTQAKRQRGNIKNLQPRPLKTEVRALGNVKLKDLNPILMHDYDDNTLRKAYTELRRVAKTRIERGMKSGIIDQKHGEYWQRLLPTLTQIDKDAASVPVEYYWTHYTSRLENSIMWARQILIRDTTTKSGFESRRSKTLETLRLKGGAYTYITEDNIDEFGEYMESLREKYDLERGSKGSEQAVLLFRAYRQEDIAGEEIIKDFKFWQGKHKELSKLAKTRAGKARKLEQAKKMLTRKSTKISRREKKKTKNRKRK